MIAYHVTTPKKLARYKATGAILSPVRFWSTMYQAKKWAKKTGRTIILIFDAPVRSWPLSIKGGAWWTDENVKFDTGEVKKDGKWIGENDV